MPVDCSGRGARPDDLAPAVVWVQADVSAPEDAARIFATAHTEFGPVSILVNNAGVQVEKTVVDSSDDDWEQVMGVNARGVFLTYVVQWVCKKAAACTLLICVCNATRACISMSLSR